MICEKNNKTVHICVPTYKEHKHVILFIKCLLKNTYKNWIVYIVNANPEDDLGDKIMNLFKEISEKIILIDGKESEYWSATVNRGLYKIKDYNKQGDKLIIANVDNTFSSNLLNNLVKNHKDNIQLGCVSINNKREITKTGIRVKNWFLAINEHIMINQKIDNLKKKICKVDFLPISFVMFPIEIINKNFYIDAKFLPHYGGDYAYSLDLDSKGYTPYIDFSSVVRNQEENTGFCIYKKKIKLIKRIKNLFSIKNPSSLKHRFWLVMRYYPLYARPTAFISYAIKSLFETLLGGFYIGTFKKVIGK
tara:strand:+ start:19374 stop:20291 length:918 start_codon:yes stop_codon:yes gene_type:complete